MWHLTGDDIQRVKEELKGRRAAIKAHYDSEMKQLEADIAAIEGFERAAVDFVSNFKTEDDPTAKGADERVVTVVDPEPAAEPIAADGLTEQKSATHEENSVERAAEAEAAPDNTERVGGKGSSRWRMRLGTP
jgi:molybdopterin-guanine dinucleotide biosynthesis protein